MEGLKRISRYLPFGILYMLSFWIVENRNVKYYIIHTELDEILPFCEYFVIPYLLWFAFVAVTVMYFAFFVKNRKEYDQLMWSFCIGMTLFVVISFLFPNGQKLRPRLAGEDGFFIDLVRMVYSKDTPTNIFPSIHVYNSVVCCTAILKNEQCRANRWITISALVLTVLIIAATVFIKQHSIIDLVGALLLNALVGGVVYGTHPIYPVRSRRVIS